MKSLLRSGDAEGAEILIPEITAHRHNEKELGDAIMGVGRTIGRIKGLLSRIGILSVLRSVNIGALDLQALGDLKQQAQEAMASVDAFSSDLASTLETTGRSELLKGTLNEEETQDFRRLVAESRDELQGYVEEIKATERQAADMVGNHQAQPGQQPGQSG